MLKMTRLAALAAVLFIAVAATVVPQPAHAQAQSPAPAAAPAQAPAAAPAAPTAPSAPAAKAVNGGRRPNWWITPTVSKRSGAAAISSPSSRW